MMKTTTRVSLAAVFSVVLGATSSQAARFFISTQGVGELAPSDVAGAPTIFVTSGSEYDLHVWLLPDPDQQWQAVSYSVQATNASATTGVQSVIDNPINPGNGLTRWSNVNGGTLNAVADVDPTPGVQNETFLVNNARGATIIIGTNAGIGTLPIHETDASRDPASGAFHLGQFRVLTTPDGAGAVGLYLRQGQSLMSIRNSSGTTITNTVPLFFGDDQTSPINAGAPGRNRGDQITPDLAFADAIIQLVCAGCPIGEIIQFEADPGNDGPHFVTGPPSNVVPIDFALMPANAMGRLEVLGVEHSFFDVFLDLNNNDPNTLAAIQSQLQTQEADEGLNFVRLVPDDSNPLGNGIDYDIQIQYTNTPGANRLVDFDFSSIPGILVNHVAIPEPCAGLLTSLAMVFVMVARLRAARLPLKLI